MIRCSSLDVFRCPFDQLVFVLAERVGGAAQAVGFKIGLPT